MPRLSDVHLGEAVDPVLVALSSGTSPVPVHAPVTAMEPAPECLCRSVGGRRASRRRETGEAIAITLWEDEQALRASEEQASQLRAAVAEEMHASEQPTVNRYEVAVFET